MDLGPSDHQFNTCLNRDLSDGSRLRFNHAFDDSLGNTCLRKEALIKIGGAKKRENMGLRHGIVAQFKRVIVAAIQLLFVRSKGPRFSWKNLYKIVFFHLVK